MSIYLGKSILVVGAGSDIGSHLAMSFLDAGARVVGTFRNPDSVSRLQADGRARLFACDITQPASVTRFAQSFGDLCTPWDIFISCVGLLEPIGPFFACDFDAWEDSVRVNSSAQLRVLHALHPLRRTPGPNHVVFFAGGGTNSPFRNYSAYCIGKLQLIKMCELLDDEAPHLNAVILGTGWVNTKIHRQTMAAHDRAGTNLARTAEFLRAGSMGTSFQDIFDCISWCISADREAVGGRNFSVVHDPWRSGGASLLAELRSSPDKFKLRRCGNSPAPRLTQP